MDQVNQAMSQMNAVVQQNAASSEESSSAAAELSGQSAELAAMVATFQLEPGAAESKEVSPWSPAAGWRRTVKATAVAKA